MYAILTRPRAFAVAQMQELSIAQHMYTRGCWLSLHIEFNTNDNTQHSLLDFDDEIDSERCWDQ